MKISKFYKTEYANAALYQSFRTIASFIDGHKVGGRKIFYTVDKKNITTNYKVANLAADTSSLTEFIHAAGSLEGAIVTMAQTISNNYNLLEPEGFFGNRLKHEAAASRYIFTKKSKWFDSFFNEDDKKLIKYREFEGKSIEPFFYVPIVPVLLLNGAEGIGNGYAQKIMPRRLEDVVSAIGELLAGKRVKRITPWVDGFNGTIKFLEDNKIEVRGAVDVKSASITITEIPMSYDLSSYIKKLDLLVDKNIIKDYTDLSEGENFKFEVRCTKEFCKQSEYEILDALKLIDRLTENFTCVSEKDSIVVFENEIDLLKSFVKIRKEYYIKRKEYLLETNSAVLKALENKVRFIKMINDGEIVIFKKSKTEVQSLLEENKFDKLPSYEYILEMRVDSLTNEKADAMQKQAWTLKQKVEEIKTKTVEDFWLEDLKGLQ